MSARIALLLALGLRALPVAALSIHAGQVYDVERGVVLEAQRIEIEGERITALRPIAADDPAPDLDWRDQAVMPGWIDAHTHLIGDIQSADVLAPLQGSAATDVLDGVVNARVTLRAGFTTVRDVGCYRGLTDVALRDAIAAGKVEGPRMLVAGAYLTAPGGGGEVSGAPGTAIPPEFRRGVARGEAEVRQRVAELAAAGVDFIKIIATGAVLTEGTEPGALEFSEAELRAAVEEATKHKLDVTAHAHGAEGIKAAIRAGVRSIEHASLIDAEGIALAKRHGVFLAMDIYNGDYIDAVGRRDGWSAAILRKNKETTEAQRDGFRRALAAGVAIVFATDAGVFPHGDNARQFGYLIRHGMSEMQAIQAATVVAARLLRREAEIGSLKVGKRADLVALPRPAAGQGLDFAQPPRVIQGGRLRRGPGSANVADL